MKEDYDSTSSTLAQERLREKLQRLVTRAELAQSFPGTNFDEMENKIIELVKCQKNWSIQRSMEGLSLSFTPVESLDEEESPNNIIIGFTEWNKEIALHIILPPDSPLYCSGHMARNLARLITTRKDNNPTISGEDGEKSLLELLRWSKDDTSPCFVPGSRPRTTSRSSVIHFPSHSTLEFKLLTGEIPGSLAFGHFPLPLDNLETRQPTFLSIMKLMAEALTFDRLVQSCITSRRFIEDPHHEDCSLIEEESSNIERWIVDITNQPKIGFLLKKKGRSVGFDLNVEESGEINVVTSNESFMIEPKLLKILHEGFKVCHHVPLVLVHIPSSWGCGAEDDTHSPLGEAQEEDANPASTVLTSEGLDFPDVNGSLLLGGFSTDELLVDPAEEGLSEKMDVTQD